MEPIMRRMYSYYLLKISSTAINPRDTRHRYVYFEKVRILEGKKKTAKRERNEDEIGVRGFPLQDRSKVWVFTGR